MYKSIMASLIFILLLNTNSFAQWSSEWSTSNITSGNTSGWLSFQKNGNEWNNCFYEISTSSFSVMQSAYSGSAVHTYNFNAAEVLAGNQVYSLGIDLTGDNITEFYVLGYYGTAEPYRQSMKIFDIVTGNVLFEKNDAANYYSYPVIWDVDNDGTLECTFSKYDYPNFAGYVYEVYNTNITTSVKNENPIQTTFTLDQNYPNPFNPETNINYSTESSGKVTIRIFDIKGELVKTLFDGDKAAGEYSVKWNGTNYSGIKVSSGTYFYRIQTGSAVQTKKMIMIK